MVVQRKRYRIEEAIGIDVPIVVEEVSGGEVGPMHREIMAELRAIRAQLPSCTVAGVCIAMPECRCSVL